MGVGWGASAKCSPSNYSIFKGSGRSKQRNLNVALAWVLQKEKENNVILWYPLCECQMASGGDKIEGQKIVRSSQDLQTIGLCSQPWRKKPILYDLQPDKSQGHLVPHIGYATKPDV